MRRILVPVAAMILVCALPPAAFAQATNRSIQGFGGFTFDSSSIVGTSAAPTFGGVVTGGLTPNIQIIGEVGRMADIKPPLLDLLDLTPVGLRVTAPPACG